MRCWRRSPAARARRCVFFSQLRRRLHLPDHRRAGVDRLRRADPAAVQAEGRREGRRRAEPRSARRSATSAPAKKAGRRRRRCTPWRSRATATRCGSASRRSSSRARARAAAMRGRPRAPRSSASRRLTGGEVLIAATAEARGLLCKAEEVNFLSGPGQGRHPDQAGGRGRSRARLHRLDRRPRSADRRNDARRRADDQHRRNTR